MQTEVMVGGVTYIVTAFFNENACKSVEDKLVQLLAEQVVAEYITPANGEKSSMN
jgi:hypothetical protein